MKEKILTRDFLFLTTANLLMAIAFYFMTPVMALFMADTFGSGKNEIGMVMFAFTISAILMRPFAGYLLDGLNRYTVYAVSFVLFSLAFLGYPIAVSFAFLLALRFFHGLTWGSINTAAYTLAVDLVPEKRKGEGLGIFGLSMNVAMAIGPMLAVMISKQAGYNQLFYAAVGFCAVGFLLVLLLNAPKNKKLKRRFGIKSMFEKKAVPVSFNVMLTQIPYGGIISFVALYGREIGVINGGTFFLLMAVSLAVSRVLSGRTFDKFGPRNVTLAGISLLITGLLCIGFFSTPAGFHFSAIVLGFGFGVISPTFQAMANNNVAPEKRGAANSTYLMFFDSGVGLGMLLFGALIDVVGYAGTFYVSAAIQCLALVVFFTVTLPRYRRANAGNPSSEVA